MIRYFRLQIIYYVLHSVDNVKIEPVIKYRSCFDNFQEKEESDAITQDNDHQIQNDDHQFQNGDHQFQNGGQNEEEINDDAPINIISGADWESLNYSVLNVSWIFF